MKSQYGKSFNFYSQREIRLQKRLLNKLEITSMALCDNKIFFCAHERSKKSKEI